MYMYVDKYHKKGIEYQNNEYECLWTFGSINGVAMAFSVAYYPHDMDNKGTTDNRCLDKCDFINKPYSLEQERVELELYDISS